MAATTRNKGYGNDGKGGPVTDSSLGEFPNPNAGRTKGAQDSPPTTSVALPIVNATVAVGDEFSLGQYLFQGEFNELIVCHTLIEDEEGVETEGGRNVNIVKPPQFRKSVVDTAGEEVNGEIVTYAPDETGNLQGTRKREFEANGGTLILLERIDPPYLPDERIYAAEAQATGVTGLTLLAQNMQARRWKNILPAERYFQIAEINKDTFWGQEWDFATNAQKVDAEAVLLPRELIAKPHLMRGSVWDGVVVVPPAPDSDTVDSFTANVNDDVGVLPDPEENEYTIREVIINPESGQNTTEDQDVIPRWYPAITIIRAEPSELGTGAFRTIPGDPAGAVQAIWQDRNDGAHAFAEKFA